MEYSKHPEFWFQSEELHTQYKKENKELKQKYRKLFEKKYGKKKKKKSESDESES